MALSSLWLCAVTLVVFITVAMCYMEGDIVLLGGSRSSQGTVSIYWQGRWGTLCDPGWGEDEATTVCRQLGFNWTNALTATNGFFGRSKTMKPHTVQFKCPRVKKRLKRCRKYYWKVSCKPQKVAGVDCEPRLDYNETATQVRLVDKIAPNVGAIEIQYQGTWGAVCDSAGYYYWNHYAAQWACGKMGFSGDGGQMSIPVRSKFPRGKRKVWHDFVNCKENVTSFSECILKPWGNAVCAEERIVGVICDPEEASYNLSVLRSSDLQFRWVNGSDDSGGLLELYMYGMWAPVHAISVFASQLICRKHGYPWGGTYYKDEGDTVADGWHFSGYVWSADIDCKGNETRFEDCLMSSWERKYITSGNRAWIRCLTSPHAEPPEVATASTDVKEGDRITLMCSSGKGNMEKHPELSWYCDFRDGDCGSYICTAEQVVVGDETFKNLTIVANKYANGHGCSCTAFQRSGWFWDAYLNFTVAYTPSQPEVTLSSPVRENHPATVTCNVTQINPLPKIFWYRGSRLLTNIDTTRNVTRDSTGGFNVIENYTFLAKRWHTGKRISCVVYNERAGKSIRKGVVPDVHFSPILTVKVHPENLSVGGKVKFTCAVLAKPSVIAFWRRDTGDMVSPLSNFTLASVRPSDSGAYMCIANGRYGETTKAFAKVHVTDGQDK